MELIYEVYTYYFSDNISKYLATLSGIPALLNTLDMYCLTAWIDPPEYKAFSDSSLCASSNLIAAPFLEVSYAFLVSSLHLASM